MLTSYKTPQAYLQATKQFLQARELQNNLILGLCNSFGDETAEQPNCVFINAFDGDAIKATSIKTLNKAIVAGNTTNAAFIKPLADYYLANYPPLDGVFGEPFYAEAFAHYHTANYFRQMTLIVHKLNTVNQVSPAKGSFELAITDDIETLVNYSQAFDVDAHTTIKKTRDDILADTQRKIAQGKLFKWVYDDVIVSIAAIVRQTDNVGIVGLVYTPAQYRGKGYASNLVQQLSANILDQGFKYCALFTDKANPTSNHIYKKIGYESVTEFADISFEQ